MSSLSDSIRSVIAAYRRVQSSTSGHSMDVLADYYRGVNAVLEHMEETLKQQSNARQHPHSGLEDIADLAKELGFDVTKGFKRIMVSFPIPKHEGDDIIEQSFPRETTNVE